MSRKSSLYKTCSGKPKAPICPYCEFSAELQVNSADLYNGKDYGPVWLCGRCAAWVGCHPGTHIALGRLANKELRKAKMAAHAAFDPLWKTRRKRTGDKWSRKQGYKWLAEQLGIARADCHIGMFDVETCKRVVEICKPHLERVFSKRAA